MGSTGEGWLPIDGSPYGLVTWYTPLGPVARLTSWLAVVNGVPPELHAGCPGQFPEQEHLLPVGVDFAINLPAREQTPELRELLREAGSRPTVLLDAGLAPRPARLARAPLLPGCVLQIECAHGRLLPGGWEPELAGDVLLLHRGSHFLAPADHADFCALRPLRAVFPS